MNKATTRAKTFDPPELQASNGEMTAGEWARFDAMTDEEVLAAARSDPDAMPAEDYPPGRLGPPRRVAFARHARWKLGYSQSAFAQTFRIPLGTLRDWEQHRREPDQAARAYLEVIAREPEAVRRALAAAAGELPAAGRQGKVPPGAAAE